MTTTQIPTQGEHLVHPTELREAVRDGAMTVHYQPKLDLATGVVGSVEALVRWNHPERGLVPPSEFVPIAERTDVIHPLTRTVAQQALTDCGSWLRAGTPLQVAVNISNPTLMDPSFPLMLARGLRDAGLPAPMLTLDIAEGAITANPDRIEAMLGRLKALGVDLAVDLGTDPPSLSYLEQLPIDEIKIDRLFVRSMASNGDDAAVVEAVVALGHRLSRRVVAEGVEDAATYAALRAMGCDEAQGYFMSRPVPAALIPNFVRDWRPPVN